MYVTVYTGYQYRNKILVQVTNDQNKQRCTVHHIRRGAELYTLFPTMTPPLRVAKGIEPEVRQGSSTIDASSLRSRSDKGGRVFLTADIGARVVCVAQPNGDGQKVAGATWIWCYFVLELFAGMECQRLSCHVVALHVARFGTGRELGEYCKRLAWTGLSRRIGIVDTVRMACFRYVFVAWFVRATVINV